MILNNASSLNDLRVPPRKQSCPLSIREKSSTRSFSVP